MVFAKTYTYYVLVLMFAGSLVISGILRTTTSDSTSILASIILTTLFMSMVEFTITILKSYYHTH
jgi:hypothetical protein